MKCRNCGAEAIEGDIFCGECGKALVSEEPRKEKSSIRNKLIIFVVIAMIGVLLFIYWTGWSKESEPPRLSASPEPLSFNLGSMDAGETASKTLSISNAGGGTLTWSVSDDQPWIDVSPTSGTNSGDVTISINTTGLRQGSYSGTVTITTNGEEKKGSVSLDITAPTPITPTPIMPTPTIPTPTTPASTPLLSVSPDPPNFDFGSMNAGASTSQSLLISNAGEGTLVWSVSANQPWITVNPTDGTNSGTVTISVNTAGLSAGSYSGTVTITSNGGTKRGNIHLNIPATPTPTPVLSVSPDPPNIDFGTACAGDSKSSQLSISNSGSGTLTWSISADAWVTVSPSSGTNSNTVTVSVNTTGMSPGSHSGAITVNSNVGTIPGSLSLNIIQPQLSVSPDPLNFNFGGMNAGASDSRTVSILYSNPDCPLTWSVSADQPWITVNPMSGTNSGTVTISINTAGLSAGSYSGTVTLTSNAGTKTGTISLNVVSIVSTGSLDISQTWTADLDKGVVGATSDSDIWFEAVTANERYVVPQNGATIAKVGTTSVGLNGCMATTLSTTRININDLPADTFVCVRTNLGRYSEFRVKAPVGPSPGTLSIEYTTWEAPSSIRVRAPPSP